MEGDDLEVIRCTVPAFAREVEESNKKPQSE
jgi:hypothetical protein